MVAAGRWGGAGAGSGPLVDLSERALRCPLRRARAWQLRNCTQTPATPAPAMRLAAMLTSHPAAGTRLPAGGRPQGRRPIRRPPPAPRASGGDAPPPTPTTASPPNDWSPDGAVADVDEVVGVRVVPGESGRPRPEYLVKWKAGRGCGMSIKGVH